ncbi:hypothetical protein T440DRAFT_66498 [Plenodomus tracheiphilus IPT5]|uniref:Uncharacterized protein n=1 Tax=Plenodomus tracheiphilus IPT5 TaxID=1408161 RepID=A0A6A7B7T7_9PLEO|nr:hypothetical protein T440DRAFT_66498 [Plenodomus tracheiphilus IPT5]
MPRPCQKRRASAAANRKPPKPAAPPPIRHKARQKAIHNARRGRGRGRGGGNHTGRPAPQADASSGGSMEHDFIAFASSGNDFHMLRGAGSRNDPMALQGSGLQDGDCTDDSDNDSDMDSDGIDVDDLDMYEAQDMLINVDVSQPAGNSLRVRLARAEVMFTVPRAVAIYKQMRLTGFPLPPPTAVRYGAQHDGASPDSAAQPSLVPSLVPSPTSRQPSVSSATSHASHVESKAGMGRDYVFDFGKHAGMRFEQVPENYLRTIGGQLHVYEPKHPGLREAFDYYRPGRACSATAPAPAAPAAAAPPPWRQPSRAQPQPQPQPQSQSQFLLPVPPKRTHAKGSSETWTFRKGPHKKKRLAQVPENYLRTLEGMPKVVEKWPGFKAALHDFNERTGRRGRI